MRGLLARLAEKDAYTATHTRNVALLAVQVGEELGLSPQRLRTIAIGGLVHDVGKLSVPDAILKKPAGSTTTSTARSSATRSTATSCWAGSAGSRTRCGASCCTTTSASTAAATRSGLRGGELDLDTRILTVCDVFDALTANRVYREAWPGSARSSCCGASRARRSTRMRGGAGARAGREAAEAAPHGYRWTTVRPRSPAERAVTALATIASGERTKSV